MAKPWYSIKAAVEGNDTAEVSILDAISPWYGVDAKSFLTEFRALKANKVKLYINSPGGSVFEALAIFNGMRATGKEIEVHVLGIAASAASYIAMAGDKVVMPANTMMFLHNPINAVYGNAEDMREMADTLDKIGASLTATYAKRWKGEEQALLDVLAAESYLTAAECLEHGLCDEVTPEITAEARFEVDALPEAVQALFRRTQPVATRVPVAEVERVAAELGVADHVAVFAADPKLTTLAAVRAAAEDAAEIVALCRIAGRAADATAFLRQRKSLDTVRAEINARLVAEDAAQPIETAQPLAALQGAPRSGFDPGAIWRDINSRRAK